MRAAIAQMMPAGLYRPVHMLTRTIKWSWLKALRHEDRQKTRNETRDRHRSTADGGRDPPYMG
jgi:hypothetical protein